jgi:hypothetical protein
MYETSESTGPWSAPEDARRSASLRCSLHVVLRGGLRAGGHADGTSQRGSTFVTRDRTRVHLGHGKGQKESSHTRKTNIRTAPAGARHKVLRPPSTRREPSAVFALAASTTFRARRAPPGTGPSPGRGGADLA